MVTLSYKQLNQKQQKYRYHTISNYSEQNRFSAKRNIMNECAEIVSSNLRHSQLPLTGATVASTANNLNRCTSIRCSAISCKLVSGLRCRRVYVLRMQYQGRAQYARPAPHPTEPPPALSEAEAVMVCVWGRQMAFRD